MSPEIRGLWPNIVLFVATQQDKRLDLQGPHPVTKGIACSQITGYLCKCASLEWTHQKKGKCWEHDHHSLVLCHLSTQI